VVKPLDPLALRRTAQDALAGWPDAVRAERMEQAAGTLLASYG